MKSLRYIPALNEVTGSINATLLMGQLEYWFEKTECKAFYKFTEACEASQYQLGDSWCEELGFSKAEFRSAFAKIGKVYKSKKAYLESQDKFEGKYYLSYYDRIKHLTYYVRNEEKLKSIYTQIKSVDLGEVGGVHEIQAGNKGISQGEQCLAPQIHKVNLREAGSNTSTNAQTASPISIDYIQRLHSEIKESCACEEVVANYHRICPTLPAMSEMTQELREQIEEFIHKVSQTGYTVQQILEKVASSDFLCGRLSGRNWRASLQWVMKGERYQEILADKYRNRESNRSIQQSAKQSRFHKIASHNWDFAELERLEQGYIEEKLKSMTCGTNPLLSRLSLG